MVLDDVSQRAGMLVERAPVLDAYRLRNCDMHVADIAPVPDGLEDRVGETEGEHVLHCLFAHVVVDPVDLRLVEACMQGLVECHRGLEVPTKGLLDHEPGELAPSPGLVQSAAGEATCHLPEQRRDGGEVEDAVAARATAFVGGVELGHDLRDPREGGIVVVVADHIPEALRQLGPGRFGVGDGRETVIAELVVGPRGPRDPDEAEALGQGPLARQRGERRQELPRGEIARRSEYHERNGRDPGWRTLRCHADPFSSARRTAWPPNWLRKAASSRSP